LRNHRFDLQRIDTESIGAPVTIEEFQEDSERRTYASINSSQQERQSRLANAVKKPKTTTVIVEAYVRNPNVIAEVLERASGICEGCQNPAPFNRRRDGTPYLEVHHKVPLSLNGEDTVENAIALCPNCHRQEHYGPAKWASQTEDLPTEIE
jgi:5-methylcytosine-specific restriction protein A